MFNVNNRFWQFLNKMADQLLLTLLYSLCCLPLFTVGTATAAYFSVSMELHQDLEGAIFRDFWKQMGTFFKRGTVLWLLEVAVGALLVLDLWLCWKMRTQIGYFLIPFLLVLLVGLLVTGAYALALVPHTDCSLKQLINCAGNLAVTYLPYSVSMLALLVLCGAMATMYSWAVWHLPAVALYQFSRIFVWVFRRTPGVQVLLLPGDPLKSVKS